MAALPENRLLLTGKVVSLTGRIESRLAECGAVGTGLREKTDSLGSKLSPEVVKLLAYIGSIRNRFAHEPEAEISGEEFALFEESVRMVQQELDILWPVSRSHRAEVSVSASLPEEEFDESPYRGTEPDSDWLILAGRLPVLHLAYAVHLFWRAVTPGIRLLGLLVGEVLGILLIAFGIWKGEPYVTGFGSALFLMVHGFGIWEAHRDPVKSLPAFLYMTPGLNLFYFLLRLLPLLNWMMLFESFAIIMVWVAAIVMAARGEITIAGGLAFLSYIGGVVATSVRR